jgi:hypothetical protein
LFGSRRALGVTQPVAARALADLARNLPAQLLNLGAQRDDLLVSPVRGTHVVAQREGEAQLVRRVPQLLGGADEARSLELEV